MSNPAHPGAAPSPEATVAPAAPTAAHERIAVFDVLRGCALYGVLLANTVQLYSGRMFMPRATLQQQADTADQVFLFCAISWSMARR